MTSTSVLVWYVSIALILALFVLVLYVLPSAAGAVELSIVGHITGQGYQNLSYAGDALNVSLLQNGTFWNITLEAAA